MFQIYAFGHKRKQRRTYQASIHIHTQKNKEKRIITHKSFSLESENKIDKKNILSTFAVFTGYDRPKN